MVIGKLNSPADKATDSLGCHYERSPAKAGRSEESSLFRFFGSPAKNDPAHRGAELKVYYNASNNER